MSVVLCLADSSRRLRKGREVPQAVVSTCSKTSAIVRSIFDHLVGAGEEHWRNVNIERFSRSEIDNKGVLKPGRLCLGLFVC